MLDQVQDPVLCLWADGRPLMIPLLRSLLAGSLMLSWASRKTTGKRATAASRSVDKERFAGAGDVELWPPKTCRPGADHRGPIYAACSPSFMRIDGGACVLDGWGTAARPWLRLSSIMESLVRIPAMRHSARRRPASASWASRSFDCPLHYGPIKWRGPPLRDQLVGSFSSLPYLDLPFYR
jgi:hypothetical protein